MKHPIRIIPVLAALLAISCTNALSATEQKFSRTFTAAPGGSLRVDVDFGNLEITGGAENQVTIEAVRSVRGKSAQAEVSFLDERPIVAEQEGNRITLRARKPLTKGIRWNWGMKESSGRFIITVPSKFDVQLNTAGGHIHVTDIAGATRADTSGGGLKFVRTSGPLRGNTSGGGIVVTSCSGDLHVNTSGGGIQVAGGEGSLQAESSGGSISVKDFAGQARVETSGGGLALVNIGGELKGHTSGGSIQATLPQPVPGPVRLETSGGGIVVAVAQDPTFELDASTTGGNCSSEIALAQQTSDRQNRRQLRGVYGDGGPKVVLRSSGGGIRIRRASENR